MERLVQKSTFGQQSIRVKGLPIAIGNSLKANTSQLDTDEALVVTLLLLLKLGIRGSW